MAVSGDILSDKLHVGEDSATATREVKLGWGDIQAFITELMGSAFTAGVGYTVNWKVRHPVWTWCVVTGVDFEPFIDDPPHGTGSNYENGAKAVISYEGELINADDSSEEKPETPEGTELSIDVDMGVEMLTLPDHALEWDSDGKPLDGVDAGKLIHTSTYRMTWTNVTDPPWTDIEEMRGKINAGVWAGHKAETMLFTGAQVQRKFTDEGASLYTLTMTFLKRSVDIDGVTYGWLHTYRAGSATEWDKPKNKTSGNYMYETADLQALFRMA